MSKKSQAVLSVSILIKGFLISNLYCEKIDLGSQQIHRYFISNYELA